MICKLCGRDDGSHDPTCLVSVAPRPWRTGTKVGRTIYNSLGELIGVMDSRAIAALVVEAVNAYDKAEIDKNKERVFSSVNADKIPIRRSFTLTDTEHRELREAHSTFDPLALRFGPRPFGTSDRAMKAWQTLAVKHGFDEMTVKMDPTNDHVFTAVIR